MTHWKCGAAGLMLVCALSACARPAPVPDIPTPEPKRPQCSVRYVVDGDTVQADCPGAPNQRVRLLGFDTPETFKPACPAERALGQQSKAALRTRIDQASRIEIRFQDEPDRYGRRLGRLELDGTDAGSLLISDGLALPYHGGKRPDWCARLNHAA